MSRRPGRRAIATALAALGLTALTACGSAPGESGEKLAADADLPAEVPSGTVLRIGDPATQTAIEASGLDQELEDDGVEIEWANISGGPKTLEAFRAQIDLGERRSPGDPRFASLRSRLLAEVGVEDDHEAPPPIDDAARKAS